MQVSVVVRERRKHLRYFFQLQGTLFENGAFPFRNMAAARLAGGLGELMENLGLVVVFQFIASKEFYGTFKRTTLISPLFRQVQIDFHILHFLSEIQFHIYFPAVVVFPFFLDLHFTSFLILQIWELLLLLILLLQLLLVRHYFSIIFYCCLC